MVTLHYTTPDTKEVQVLQVKGTCLDDALIQMYEIHEDAEMVSHDIDIPEPETETIAAAIEYRKKYH